MTIAPGSARFSVVAAAAITLTAHAAAQPVSIPLCEGLTIVTAIADPKGDYESIKRVTKVDPDLVHLVIRGDKPVRGGLRRINVTRSVRQDDLRSATFYLHIFDTAAPTLVPGSTALGTSAAVLSALKKKGEAVIAVVDPSARAAPAEQMRQSLWSYPLKRVAAITLPVIVNGSPVQLPAIQARGTYLGDSAEFFFLDDERNPLTLRYAFASGPGGDDSGRLQVVQISYACHTGAEPAESRLERALRETGAVDVYEILFDFGSDRIRPESETIIQEIGAILKRHREWRLAIEGHTDSVASEAYNLDLSNRRAAAVKTALSTTEGVDAQRLTTAGLGESRPKDRNDTLEGRARNRRVTLIRQ